jgi:fumarate hydratase class I
MRRAFGAPQENAMERFRESIHQLIVATSTNLPPDVRRALQRTRACEAAGTRSAFALHAIALNVDMAEAHCGPICQDTGMPCFEVKAPAGVDELLLSEEIGEAVAQATQEGKLRPNSVDSLTGKNSGNNLGPGTPIVHCEQWLSNDIEVRLILKGGGCENKSAQYSLPCDLPHLGRADRDLEGVRKCVLHAVHQAQGQGCSVGVIGVAIGGDRASGYAAAKEQLFRTLDDVNPDPTLARLEREIVEQSDTLGVGTMGFGGAVTLLDCKMTSLNRLPASFFVTVSYNCWALRRQGVLLDSDTGEVKHWLHADAAPTLRMARETTLPRSGREVALETPLTRERVLELKIGDVVLLSGVIHTGRDALHRHLIDHEAPIDLQGAAIYHCGPVMVKQGEGWVARAAGPTTSSREEPYQAEVIRRFGIRAVIGKGGMGARTLAALADSGAVYLSAIGGAAQYYAECVLAVEGVDLLEFGVPEAMWHLRVKDMPLIVTMDAHGRSLHADVERASTRQLSQLVGVPAR